MSNNDGAAMAISMSVGEELSRLMVQADHLREENERLREALQGAKTIINLLCQGFDVEPKNVVINVTSENEDGEEVFVKSISAQDVLTEIHAALGEEE